VEELRQLLLPGREARPTQGHRPAPRPVCHASVTCSSSTWAWDWVAEQVEEEELVHPDHPVTGAGASCTARRTI